MKGGIYPRWNDETTVDMVNIYAPNNEREKIAFFKRANHIIKRLHNKNNMMLVGDFNCAEDRLDRLPMTKDDNKIITALQLITKDNKLIDGWRETNPQEKDYTFESTTGSLARIDRIYIKEQNKNKYDNWKIITSANISDHEVVTTEIQKLNTPYIGKGLWKMDTSIIEEKNFRKRTAKVLNDLETTLKENNTTDPREKRTQRLWFETKNKIKEIAKEVKKQKKKEQNRKRDKVLNTIHNLKERIGKERNETEREKVKTEIRYNKQQLAEMEKDNINKVQSMAKKSFHIKGEKCTKWYFNLNKEKREKEHITKLTNKEGQNMLRTEEMVKIASEHHKELQKEQRSNQEREQATELLHSSVKSKLTRESKKLLEDITEETEISEALRKTANSKSPGKDGIPYEFFKMWLKPRKKEKTPDIIYILKSLYNSIETDKLLQPSLPKLFVIVRTFGLRVISLSNTFSDLP